MKTYLSIFLLLVVSLAGAQTKFPNTVIAPTIVITNGPPVIGQVWSATSAAGAGAWSNSPAGAGGGAGSLAVNDNQFVTNSVLNIKAAPQITNITGWGSATNSGGHVYVNGGSLIVSNPASHVQLKSFSATASLSGQVLNERSRGTESSPTAALSGDTLASWQAAGYGATQQKQGAGIDAIALGNFTDTSVPTVLTLRVGGSGAAGVRPVLALSSLAATNNVLVVLNSNAIYVPGAGTIGQVLGAADTSGTLMWTNAGTGTPGGANFDVQYNNAGAFGGNTGFRYLPSGVQVQIANGVDGEVDINGVGFISQGVGGKSLALGIGSTTNLIILADGKIGMGTFVPASSLDVTGQINTISMIVTNSIVGGASNVLDFGTRLLPVGTNFMMGFQLAPGAKNNANLKSDANGFGSWGNPIAGGNGNTNFSFAPAGAIQFAVTNTADANMMLDSTNYFLYDRTNNAVLLYNPGEGTSLKLHGSGFSQTGDNQDLTFGIGGGSPVTNWSVHGQVDVKLGSFEPYSSNKFSIGSPTATVSNLFVNDIDAKVRISVGTGSGLGSIITLYDSAGTNFELRTPTMASNVMYRWPKNETPGVMVAVGETGTNQMTNITLTAGQYVTMNGSGIYVATNGPDNSELTNNVSTKQHGSAVLTNITASIIDVPTGGIISNATQVIYQMGAVTVIGANSNQTIWLGKTNVVDMLISTNVTFTNFNGILAGYSGNFTAIMKVTNSASNLGVNWGNLGGSNPGYAIALWTNANAPMWTTLTNTKTYVLSVTSRGTNLHPTITLWE